ncbi:ADP-ribosylation factor GTPase-activating protein, partial [Datura stramonium]|nr:ADP-ribosylation factor GTPase-activating protein [Datura stramonium]
MGEENLVCVLSTDYLQILEGLLKLPENRECADCRGRAPRWASINLGIFICLQCSGIHRSLGVHISKVRSTTLDTWLPEQVAFMQRVGNEKSNNYWEAELPASVDRSDIGKFIRTKYQDKKWASRYAPQPALSNMTGETSEVGGKDIPRRARKYSLEEDGFSEQPPPVPITTRSRGVSLDMMDEMLNLPPINGLTGAPSVKHKEDTKDLFSLLYASEAKQDRTIVPPSRWATFEYYNYHLEELDYYNHLFEEDFSIIYTFALNIIGQEAGKSVTDEYLRQRGHSDLYHTTQGTSASKLQAYVKLLSGDSLAAGTKKQVRAPKESKAPSKQESQSTAETSNGRNLQRGSQGNSTKTT